MSVWFVDPWAALLLFVGLGAGLFAVAVFVYVLAIDRIVRRPPPEPDLSEWWADGAPRSVQEVVRQLEGQHRG